MKEKGLNRDQTKKTNRLLVLQLLCMMGGGSRTELTKRVRLAKMTVSNITAELLQNGILFEKEPLENGASSAGRKQMLLSFSEKSPLVIGIWISRDSCMGIVSTMDLEILEQETMYFSVTENASSLLEKIASLCMELRSRVSNERKILGIGIASIGPLDIRQGIILNPPNFFEIENLPLQSELERRLHLPVFMENDTNAGALAEKYFGNCTDCTDFIYIGLTNGLSAGIVLRDSLLHGRHGFAGEVGHTTIDPHGKVCYCGRKGCLETVCTVPALLQDASAELGVHCTDFESLCSLSNRNPRVLRWMLQKLESLSETLANLANILDPERILIGHEGACLPPRILQRMEEQINGEILACQQGHITIEASSFGTMAAVYGAAVVVLKKVFDGELAYDLFFGNENL